MNNFRNAALHLYSLHSKDRAWILERLPEDMQTGLMPLIDELQLLNITKDSISDYTDKLYADQLDSGKKEFQKIIKLIENAELEVVKVCLSEESPEILASIIRLMSRRWQEIFIEYANYDCKNVVTGYLMSSDNTVSHNVQYSLIKTLSKQIELNNSNSQLCSDVVSSAENKQRRRLWRR